MSAFCWPALWYLVGFGDPDARLYGGIQEGTDGPSIIKR